MTDPASLLESLSASDPQARQEAKQSLEAFVRDSNDPVAQGTRLAIWVQNEQQARVVSSILSRSIDKHNLAGLVLITTEHKGWVSTIARSAIRHWLENASSPDASEALQWCLLAAAGVNDSRTDEFICTATLEKVTQETHITYHRLVPVLENIVAQRSGFRQNMTWLLGTPPPSVPNSYAPTISALKNLLPQGDLPLPASKIPSAQNLPRPATEAGDEDATKLPRPARSSDPEPPLSLWERLFGRRAK